MRGRYTTPTACPHCPESLPADQMRENGARARVDDGAAVGAVLRKKPYTLGPGLRTLHVKNLGIDLALERLRTCPWLGVHHRYRMTRDTLTLALRA